MITKVKYVLISLFLSSSLLAFSQEGGTILENLKKDKEFSTFVKALEQTGLDDALTGPGKVTVFAPNNKAFEQDKKVFDELFKEQNIQMLTNVIAAHISMQVYGEKELNALRSDNVEDPDKLECRTLMNATFVIEPNRNIYMISSPTIGKIFITESDHSSSNGSFYTVSHCIIDRDA